MTYPHASTDGISRIRRACLRPWASQRKPEMIMESATELYERYRPNAKQSFQSPTQFLFERSSTQDESRIAQAFREPHSTMVSLLARNRLHNLRFEQRRNTVESRAVVRRYCEGFEIVQRSGFTDLIRNDARSRIIASFHCGDFLYGCASLLSLDNGGGKNYVLSLNSASNACHRNIAVGFNSKAPGPESELLLSDNSSASLSQLLRTENTAILLFCDVPPGLNETTEVKFLNRRARFSVGPALLALANKVPVLPLFNYTLGDLKLVSLASQIEPTIQPSETLRSAAQRITQTLVSLFEEVLLAHPQQWRFLSLLPNYFITSREIQTQL